MIEFERHQRRAFLSRSVYLLRLPTAVILVTILFFAGLGEVARAQDSSRHIELGDLSLEELLNIRVKTASMRQQKLADAPATSVVITRTEIQERGYTHLGEILRDLPSIDAYGNFSESFKAQFTIRGHSGNN